MEKSKKGFVYIITNGDNIKIGMTRKNPVFRLSQLQTGNHEKLNLLHYWKTDNYRTIEKVMHGYFSDLHIHGEWFKNNIKRIIDCKSFIENMSAYNVVGML